MIRSAKKILVINLRYIGDTLWMYPFIKNLKLNLPHAEISALINEGGEVFLKLLPELSEVIVLQRKAIKGRYGFGKFIRFLIQIRKKRFDTAIMLTNSDRPTIISFISGAATRIGYESDSWWRRVLLTKKCKWDSNKNPHMIEHHLQILTELGLKIYDTSLTIEVPNNIIEKTIERFSVLKTRNKKSILVHPGSRNHLRQWGVKNFAEVINSISEQYRIFLIGGPSEKHIIEDIMNNLKKSPDIVSTDVDLLEFAALCKHSDLFIGNDSAPIHIAAATGVFVIGIYGPTLSKYCGPWTDKRALFDMSTVPCRPCEQDECINQEKQACLNIVTPGMIIDKVVNISGSV